MRLFISRLNLCKLEISLLCWGLLPICLLTAWHLDHRGRLKYCPWPSLMLPTFLNWWLWVSTIKLVLARNKKYVLSDDKVQSYWLIDWRTVFRLYYNFKKFMEKNLNLLLFSFWLLNLKKIFETICSYLFFNSELDIHFL